MAADDLAERLQRLENALGLIDPTGRGLDVLWSQLDEVDARLARLEDAVYPVDPASGWGQDPGRESGRPGARRKSRSTMRER
jgi:hypothetical protein